MPPALPVSPTPPGTPLDRRWTFETLWQAPSIARSAVRGGVLPTALRARLDARLGASFEIALRPDRPSIVANFVSTLDGVVALDRAGATGGREISGDFEPDRFFMGLLRATADAVLVGAGTARASRGWAWTPDRVHPPSADAFAAWRRSLGLRTTGPAAVVVSGSGRLDLGRVPDSGVPVLVLTTRVGARRMRRPTATGGVEIVALADEGRVPVDALLGVLRDRGFKLVLSEAGPTLFGELLGARAVDELFLTVAPQIAGRSGDRQRLALVEGTAFPPADAPWGRLRGIMRSGEHLFLRYELDATDRWDASQADQWRR